MRTPRILIAGLRGGSGKTLVSLGLAAAWHRQGRRVAPFKKGPDYIDAAWLARAAGEPCRNLDLFLMPPAKALESFATGAEGADVSIGIFAWPGVPGRPPAIQLTGSLPYWCTSMRFKGEPVPSGSSGQGAWSSKFT